MAGRQQRVEKRIRERVVEWALAEGVYEALGGTPLEDALAGLPSLTEILEEIDRAVPAGVSFSQRGKLAGQKLAARKQEISARNARNAARHRIMHLARQVPRYIEFGERTGGSVDLATFVRARSAQSSLDEAAGCLGLSREVMWRRFEVAIAAAKEGERWSRYREVLDDALKSVDWEQVEGHGVERQSRFPNDGKRWSAADEGRLETLFHRLWDEGLEPPISWPFGAEAQNELLIKLSHDLGRTPGAIWKRLVSLKLLSAVPAENEAAFANPRAKRKGSR